MNNIITIGDNDYPFHFGMRTLFDYSMANAIEFDEITLQSYGDYMKIFAFAIKAAIDRGSGKGKPLTPVELEDEIDKDPEAFGRIMAAFNNSKFNKALDDQGAIEDSGNEKKPSD